ncbi:hypothetical protein BJ165DRAFT_1463452 [Panaeolus papilionaceus]|nr:hypothetical protein BJ165DRAFT_1463452 [Panaeolus papilionaceus]
MDESTNCVPDLRNQGLADVGHMLQLAAPETGLTHQPDRTEGPKLPVQKHKPSGSINPSVISASNLISHNGSFIQTTGHHITYNVHLPPPPNDAQVEVRTTPNQNLDNLSSLPLTSTDISILARSQANIAPKFEPSNKIYERHMLKKGRGYPLWVPECSQTLHIKKRKLGVEVGDVGLIDKDGCFVFLFNILRPANHPFHPTEMPEGYNSVQPLRSHDWLQTIPFGHHTALTSASVRRQEAGISGSSEQIFEMPSAEAVILTLPDGVQFSSVQTTSLWGDYMASNLKSWYKYVKVTLGYEVNNGDIRLVTGCDKASHWGMAVAEQSPTAENSYKLRFRKAKHRKGSIKYAWECNGIVDTRVGPSQEHIREVRQKSIRQYLFGWLSRERKSKLHRDQCLFVRSLNNRLGDKSWNEVKAEAEELYNNGCSSGYFTGPSMASPDGAPTSTSESKGKEPASGPRSIASNKTLQDRFVTSTPTSVRRLYTDYHPADWLSKLLLFIHPEADVAVVDDNDWCFALKNIPDSAPIDENEIICAVLLELGFGCHENIVQAVYVHEMKEPARRVAEIVGSLPGATKGHKDITGCLSIQDVIYTLVRVVHVLVIAKAMRNRPATGEEQLTNQTRNAETSSTPTDLSRIVEINFDPFTSLTIKVIIEKLALVLSPRNSSDSRYSTACGHFHQFFKGGIVPSSIKDLGSLIFCTNELQHLASASASSPLPTPAVVSVDLGMVNSDILLTPHSSCSLNHLLTKHCPFGRIRSLSAQ